MKSCLPHSLVVVYSVFFLTGAATLPPVSMSNPSFSTAAANGMPANWELTEERSNISAARDVVVYKTAPASLRIESGSAGAVKGSVFSFMPAFRLSGPFKIKMWAKATGGELRVSVSEVRKETEEGVVREAGRVRQGDWTQYSFDYDIVLEPAQISMVFMELAPVGPNTTVWIDDVALVMPTGAVMPLRQVVPTDAARPGLRVVSADGRAAGGAGAAGLRVQAAGTRARLVAGR